MIATFKLDQDGDSLVPVNVSSENAIPINHHRSANAYILTNLLDQRLTGLFNGSRLQRLNVIGAAVKYRVGDLPYKGKKVLIPGHEISLAVDLDQNSVAAVFSDSHGNHTISSDSTCLLCRFHAAGLTQCLNGRFDVVAGFCQCLFAFQQTKASALTQLFHQCCRHI